MLDRENGAKPQKTRIREADGLLRKDGNGAPGQGKAEAEKTDDGEFEFVEVRPENGDRDDEWVVL